MGFGLGALSGFSKVVSGEQARRRDEQAKQQDQELKILTSLASSEDPEISQIAAAGLLDLAQGRKGAKGLRGFLGEVEKSPHLPALSALMRTPGLAGGAGGGGGMPPAPASSPTAGAPTLPGSAAQPASSPVTPGGGGMQMPPAPQDAGFMPGAANPPDETSFPGGDQGGPAASPLGGMSTVPPPPPPPPTVLGDTPRGATQRRLFPSASEVAEVQASAQMTGKINAVTRQLQQLGMDPGTIATVVAGMAGAPQRQIAQIPVMVTLADGSTAAGSYDPQQGVFTVGGRPVQPVKVQKLMSGQGAQPRFVWAADGSGQAIDPASGEVLYTMPPGTHSPQIQPPAFGGTVAMPGGQVGGIDRETGMVSPIPGAVANPTAPSQRAMEAKGFLDAVKRGEKGAIDKKRAAAGPAGKILGTTPTVLQGPDLDALVKDTTGGKYQTYRDLEVATKETQGSAGAAGGAEPPLENPNAPTKSGLSREEIGAILEGLKGVLTPVGGAGTVQGAGLPPGPPQ